MSLDAGARPHPEVSEQDIRHPRDVWGSAVTVVIAAVALQRSVSYGIEGHTQVVGPGMFPAIVSAALLLLGLLWALQTWRKTVPQPEEPIELPDRGGVARIAITVAAMLVPALVFNLVDFRLTVFAMSFAVMRFVFGSPLVLAATVSAALSAICYFGLALGLGMVLPLSF
ncbi:tripartite tricarboxylate transporter TctB family protein [Nocardioides cavernae]|uniref:Tripartite tricarboxylate transporter TctB family protein n=1 Tax=Nocardioides cavernae TaxID=1921566 RepID=A0ABR8N7W0_9ACTN|nr:tripartite tricarboxylate transporter TctB family protein [Nocardioides cavernae]MBD3924238.1 tripartite tricarboxylate transporter TctB family protein [Nocardioides cavernae]MBM7510823.1 hypothetical protein [Nocardioides cavernae]